MFKVTISFETYTEIQLTEGLNQMLLERVNNNTFVFEVEEEEIELLIDEVQDSVPYLIESVNVNEA